jgi:hypothetical protein
VPMGVDLRVRWTLLATIGWRSSDRAGWCGRRRRANIWGYRVTHVASIRPVSWCLADQTRTTLDGFIGHQSRSPTRLPAQSVSAVMSLSCWMCGSVSAWDSWRVAAEGE